MNSTNFTYAPGETQAFTFETELGEFIQGGVQFNGDFFYSPLLMRDLKKSKDYIGGFVVTLAANGAGGANLQFVEIIKKAKGKLNLSAENKIKAVYIHEGPTILDAQNILQTSKMEDISDLVVSDLKIVLLQDEVASKERITGPVEGRYIAARARQHQFGWFGEARVFSSKPSGFMDDSSICKLGGDLGNAATELDAIENAERVARDWIHKNKPPAR
ncbi:hypothetical protein AVME950_00210 [Acidovorax sp. SUPP950]|uniref:hypothetical protein n=1 Tax=Acidovorax sp. SUPP950 TaxID=511901 RepID=UPI0023D55766|nr:hypothetical protein [Acidovorax sp. SUPP950]GKS73260.1 hypothetical protein AVME950_00210 [Acidovorax sp. SUPP950]